MAALKGLAAPGFDSISALPGLPSIPALAFLAPNESPGILPEVFLPLLLVPLPPLLHFLLNFLLELFVFLAAAGFEYYGFFPYCGRRAWGSRLQGGRQGAGRRPGSGPLRCAAVSTFFLPFFFKNFEV